MPQPKDQPAVDIEGTPIVPGQKVIIVGTVRGSLGDHILVRPDNCQSIDETWGITAPGRCMKVQPSAKEDA